jgi:hypothetical protein
LRTFSKASRSSVSSSPMCLLKSPMRDCKIRRKLELLGVRFWKA